MRATGNLVDHATTLFCWWAVWTLADAYLIPYTPLSELIVLGACVLVYKFREKKRETVKNESRKCGLVLSDLENGEAIEASVE